MRAQTAPPGPEILGPYEFDQLIGRQGPSGPRLRCPMDIAVDDAGQAIYVISRIEPRVARWSFDGDFIDDFGAPGSIEFGAPRGAVDGELLWPSSVAVARDSVYVTEEAPHRLQKFTLDGTFLVRWGGDTPIGSWLHGQFNRPSGVAVDAVDQVYVADTYNHRIQKFRPTGAFVQQWGRHGSGPGELNYPWGIEVSSALGRAYVSDWKNDRIQVFGLDGAFLTTFGRPGIEPGELRRPAGIAVDRDGNIAVADWGNNRVQVFNSDGDVLAVLTGHGDQFSKVARASLRTRADLAREREAAGGMHPLEPYFREPTGLAFDARGSLYVADTLRHRVQVYRRAAMHRT
jgi:DNA-binding beta-propeller fold protein YncE